MEKTSWRIILYFIRKKMEELNKVELSLDNIDKTEIILNDVIRQFKEVKQMLEIGLISNKEINTENIDNIFWNNKSIEKDLLQINAKIMNIKSDLFEQWIKIKIVQNYVWEEVWKIMD